MIIRSAWDRSLASEGIGSKVCESMPSGMVPVSLILSPPMFSTMLVIGATVVTTFSFFAAAGAAGVSSRRPQAGRKSAAASAKHTKLFRGFIRHRTCFYVLNPPKTAVLVPCQKHFSPLKRLVGATSGDLPKVGARFQNLEN